VLYQRFIDGRTSAQVADAMGITPEQVRFRVHRMKQKFRELFERSSTLHRLHGENNKSGNRQTLEFPSQQSGQLCE
jgi:hypothetical protein